MAARPRTLPAAIAPVLVGTAAAVERAGELPRVGGFIAALIGSVFIQIGTNLANDYSDARRGADTADRLGPGAGHLLRPGRAASRAGRDLGRVRRRGRLRHLPRGARGPGDPPGRRRSRSPPASSTRAGRGPTATPGSASSSSSSSSGSSPSTAPTTCSSRSSPSSPSAFRSPSASSPPRSSSSTTSATSRPTAAPARTRSRCGSAASAPVASTSAWWPAHTSSWWRRSPSIRVPGGAFWRCSRPRWRRSPAQAVLRRTDGPALNGALAGTGALLGIFSLLLSAGPADRRLSRCRSPATEVIPFALPFREPYVTARGTLQRREMVLLRVRDGDGIEGLGEAVPLSLRGGADAGGGRRRAARLGAARGRTLAGLSPPARCAVGNGAARSARPRGRGSRLAASSAPRAAEPVRCNATLSAGEPVAVAAQAEAWAERGLRDLQAEGRRAGRRRAGGGGARRGRGRGADQGRRQRGLDRRRKRCEGSRR